MTADAAVTIGCLVSAVALVCPMPDAWWWAVVALNVGSVCGLAVDAIYRAVSGQQARRVRS